MRQWAEQKLKKTVILFSAIIAVTVALSIPVSYFYIQRQNLATSLQHSADIVADDVSEYAFQHPDTWNYQEARLIGFLEKHLQLDKEQARLVSEQHEIDISTGIIKNRPVLIRQASVTDGVDTIAVIELHGSVFPVITETVYTFFISLFLGVLIFTSLYYWPLKALKMALSKLDGANQRLEIEISEKMLLLQEAEDLTKKLHDMAMHDPLTGLANRILYFDRLNNALNIAERNEHLIAVVMIDLDKFKPINDELGHHVGDQLLINISHRIEGALRKSDTVARLGGDEFALVLHISSTENCHELCQKLYELLKAPVYLEKCTLNVEASFGVAFYPEHSTTADHLLQKADMAMYEAKKTHSHYVIYSDQIKSN